MIILVFMQFADFLEKQFLRWQQEQGKRKTLDEFADHLHVSRPILSLWLSGKRKPGAENVRGLALVLGLEVYDVLGLPRPDADLHYLTTHWDEIPPAERKAIREQAERYLADNETKRE